MFNTCLSALQMAIAVSSGTGDASDTWSYSFQRDDMYLCEHPNLEYTSVCMKKVAF